MDKIASKIVSEAEIIKKPIDAVKALEDWHAGKKGRYVRDMGIDTTYGATCWSIILGNVNIKPGKDWFCENERAEIFAAETYFVDSCSPLHPNIVYVVDGNEMEDWPGLAAVIYAAIEKANELGL